MKRLIRIGIVSMAAAVVLFAAFHYMRAQGEGSPNAVHVPQAAPAYEANIQPIKSVPHTLRTTYFTQGLNVMTYAGGGTDTAIDNLTTVYCPWPGCTLEIEQSVIVGSMLGSGNTWGVGVQMDGSWLYFHNIGEVPSDLTYAAGTFSQSSPVKPGKHTVQSWISSDNGLTIDCYHVSYRVYVP